MESRQLLAQERRGRGTPNTQNRQSNNNSNNAPSNEGGGGKRVSYDEALSTLQSLFPNMEKDAISCVLEAHHLHVDQTIDALLAMSMDGQMSTEDNNFSGSTNDIDNFIVGNDVSNNSTTDTNNNNVNNSNNNNISSSTLTSFSSTSTNTNVNQKQARRQQRKKRKVRVELPSDFLRVPGYSNGYGSGKRRESHRKRSTEHEKNDEELQQIMTDEQLALILQDELFLNEVEAMMRNQGGYYQTSHLDNVNRNAIAGNLNNNNSNSRNIGQNPSNSGQTSSSFNMNLAAMGDGMKKRISAMYASFKNRNTSRSRGNSEENLSSSSSPHISQLHQDRNKGKKNSALVPLMSPEEDSDDDEEEVIFFGSNTKGNGKHYNGKASFGGVEMSDFTLSPSKVSRENNLNSKQGQGLGMSGSNYTPSRGPGGSRSKLGINSPNIVRVDQTNTNRGLAHGPWDGGDSDEEEEEMGLDGFTIGAKGSKKSNTNINLSTNLNSEKNNRSDNPSFTNQKDEINTDSLMESSDESDQEAAIYSKYNYKPKKSPLKGLLSNSNSSSSPHKNANNQTSRQSLHENQNLL